MTARDQVVAAIRAVAARLGVDPNLALATAEEESGLNPTATGDYGSSFGLYQLHRGGELGNLTPTQAFDPTTNATVALTEVARVAAAHPGWSPGQIAAAAQRPAKPTKYAQAVDALYAKLSGGAPPAATGGGTPPAPPAATGGGPATITTATITTTPAGLSLGGPDIRSLLIEGLAVTAGISLVVVGLAMAVRKPLGQGAASVVTGGAL